jgi:hypothetical protein
VLAISSISIDKIKNTLENDSRGKGIVEESIEIGEYYTIFILTLLLENN